MAIRLRLENNEYRLVLTQDEVTELLQDYPTIRDFHNHTERLANNDVPGHVLLNSVEPASPLGEKALPGDIEKAARVDHVHELPTLTQVDEHTIGTPFASHTQKIGDSATAGHVRLTDRISVLPGEEGKQIEEIPDFQDDVAIRSRAVLGLVKSFEEQIASIGKGVQYYRSFDFAVTKKSTRFLESAKYTPGALAKLANIEDVDRYLLLVDFSDTDRFPYYRAKLSDATWEYAGSILTGDAAAPTSGTQIGVSEFFVDLESSQYLWFPGFAVWGAQDDHGVASAGWDYYPDKTSVADNTTIVKDGSGRLAITTYSVTDTQPDRNDFETTSPSLTRSYFEWISTFFKKIRGIYSRNQEQDTAISNLQEELDDSIAQHNQDIADLSRSIADEAAAREEQDNILSSRIESESTRSQEVEQNLQTQITNEVTRATNRESDLEKLITDEETARKEADDAIKKQADTDRAACAAAHEQLSQDIVDATTPLRDDIGDLSNLEEGLAESSNLVQALNTEQQRAKDAEAELQRQIDTNSDTATEDHAQLQKAIDDEAARAKKEEQSIRDDLQSDIDEKYTELQSVDNNQNDRLQQLETITSDTLNKLNNEIDTRTRNQGNLSLLDDDLEKTSLVDAINSEAKRAKAAEKTLTDGLAKEIKERKGADGDLTTLKTNAKDNLVNAINEEITTARANENALDADIKKETTDRQAADDALSDRIDELSTSMDGQKTDLEALITAEQTRAEAAEKANAAAVTAEQARAKGEEEKLQAAIDDEASARETAVQGVSDALAEEIARATGAEGTLADLTTNAKSSLVEAINEEVAARKSDKSDLLSRLSSETTARERADRDTMTAVNNEIIRAEEVEGNLSDLQEEASSLVEAINNERTRARAAENTLDEDISAEARERQAADNELSRRITAIENSSQEDWLSVIVEERERAEAAEKANAAAIEAETERASQVESDLSTAISDETDRATAEEQLLREGKRDVVLSSSAVYTTDSSGEQTYITYSKESTPETIVQRTATGSVAVPAPILDTDAAQRGWVVEQISTATSEVENLSSQLEEETTARTAADEALAGQITELSTSVEENKLNRTGPDTFDGDLSITGSTSVMKDLTVSGNLFVKGTTTTVDSTNVQMEDNLLVLNKTGEVPVAAGGIAIRVNKETADNSYGIVYDLMTDTVKLGKGAVDESGDFTFSDGEGKAVSVREDSSLWTQHSISIWDEALKGFIHSEFTVDGSTLKSQNPMQLQSSSVSVSSGTEEKVSFSVDGDATLDNLSATGVAAETVQAGVLQNADGTASLTIPNEDGTLARVEDVEEQLAVLVEQATIVAEAI